MEIDAEVVLKGTRVDAVYDKDPEKSQDTLDETVNKSEFIFLSVPTPADKDGFNDLSIVRSALRDIESICKSPDNIILVRSTVVPGTTRALQKEFPNLRMVFNPEFLTERSANFDFINQARFIVGGDSKNTSKVAKTLSIFLELLSFFLLEFFQNVERKSLG